MVKAMDCEIVVSEFEFSDKYSWEMYEPPLSTQLRVK